MANLIKRPAFDTMFDDMLKGFFVRPLGFDASSDLASGIRMDVEEDTNKYTVHAELPGVNKDDIDVQIEGNCITINAEVKQDHEYKEGERVLRSERYYGQVSRSFQLAFEVDEEKADAHFHDGVLDLVLPKRAAGSRGHSLSIK